MTPVSIKDFILGFIRSGNAEDAALGAGIEPERARRDGLRLLSRASVRRRVSKERKAAFSEGTDIRAGLERLAFGRANDAAALVFAEEVTPDMVARADLFNVSEIKRVKGGGVEVKFFDRQKALEKLGELNDSEQGENRAKNLVEMIYGSSTDTDGLLDRYDGGDTDE